MIIKGSLGPGWLNKKPKDRRIAPKRRAPFPYRTPTPRIQIGVVVNPDCLAAIDAAAQTQALSRSAWLRQAMDREMAGEHDGVTVVKRPPHQNRWLRQLIATLVTPEYRDRVDQAAQERGLSRAAFLRYALERELVATP